MCDSKGVIHKGKTDLNKYKKEFIIQTDITTMEEAFKDSNMVLVLSKLGTFPWRGILKLNQKL